MKVIENNVISPIGDDCIEFLDSLLTEDEKNECNIKVALINEIIKARHKSGFTQKDLEIASGVKQPVIARLEKGTTDPQLSTIIKILKPLGKTLAIVPLKKKIAI